MNRTVDDPLHQRATALAAMLQAARVVDCIARHGRCDREDYATLIRSIFVQNDANPLSIYGKPVNLRVGLHLTRDLLTGREPERIKRLMRYVVGMMTLEKKLAKDPPMLARLAEGLDRIRKQADYFGSTSHENVIASIAALYGETLSTLKPRILVHGKPEHLHQSANTNRIRAGLLAGIRAAHLWRESGGHPLLLMIRRKALLRACEALIEESAREELGE